MDDAPWDFLQILQIQKLESLIYISNFSIQPCFQICSNLFIFILNPKNYLKSNYHQYQIHIQSLYNCWIIKFSFIHFLSSPKLKKFYKSFKNHSELFCQHIMKKASSVAKSMVKGKSVSSIQPYQQSRVTNRSNENRKIDSKVSKVSKANSSMKAHQPLSIENKSSLKQSKLHSSKVQPSQLPQSRRKIQSQLQHKNSYNIQNPMSFRQTEAKQHSLRAKQTKNYEEKTRVDSKVFNINEMMEKQNKQLKEKLYRLQESSLEDKEKIKTLITRISEMKRDNKLAENSSIGLMSKSKTTASYAHIIKTRGQTDRQNIQSSNMKNELQTPFRILQPSASQSKYSKQKQTCGNPACEQRRKHLEGELYKERIKRDQLQDEKREWEKNRDQLKRQYHDLLCEIQNLRNQSVCEE